VKFLITKTLKLSNKKALEPPMLLEELPQKPAGRSVPFGSIINDIGANG
jgi:hypothetical protein